MKHHSKRPLDRVRDAIRLNISSVRTEEAYGDWIKRFILFHDKRHAQEMGYSDVRAFLLHLATEEGVAASTQNQALNALLFLYREVLGKDLDGPIKTIRAKSAKRLSTVLALPRVLAVASRKRSPSSRPRCSGRAAPPISSLRPGAPGPDLPAPQIGSHFAKLPLRWK